MKPVLLLFLTILFFGCGAGVFGKQAKLDEPIELKTQETVSIQGIGLKITLNSTGREWVMDDKGKNTGERPYCNITAKLGDREEKFSLRFNNPAKLGDYVIEVKSINPFGAGSCEVMVRHKEKASPEQKIN